MHDADLAGGGVTVDVGFHRRCPGRDWRPGPAAESLVRMSCALVVGEFCPPVMADVALVAEARRLADVVVVLVTGGEASRVPADVRVAWLSRSLPGVGVITLPAGCGEGPPAAETIVRAIGARPSVVAGAPGLARAWGVRVLDDAFTHRARRQARHDPVAAWGQLPPAVRGGLAARVCFVGAESSGP